MKSLIGRKDTALQPNDTVRTAGQRMHEHDTGQWPVAEDRRLVGVVDDHELDRQITGKGHDPATWRVGELMNRDVIFCFEDEDCAKARAVMAERDLNFLPVVDREMRIVGIFSREEIEARCAATPGAEVPPPYGGHLISKL